ncbi:murein DD-endopeptidase MepM/ murein hydrolase activator NlpD [Brevundimonas bullata]|jgi:murein DD-endopeptidase MepM/ murein hydrolase activator NlpD|uniref:Murein DD-endopeptidase MepM/ murein hydrolase activator NlpD n=1 Tax=Brevundimonas bullata TaxID=13160 RepID=A0A7W7IPI2_9CAUL|nr:M23 family metallopeptidase [Brevundimonas bullata]MBB4798116.1 murein DD-endopeptidase MepM/ murein hydrolase activator NlpD [Brevundimonas bullata]MBB6383570.1 murein DD-endopeptidase MepM/ murein hydrolase activator NlpD [Brevundimonas bullata]
MAQFDPRRQPMRLAPHLLTTAAAVAIALVAGQAYEPVRAEEVPALTSEQIAYLETQAYAAAGAPAGLTAPEAIPVQIRRGETFEQAVRRTGIGAEEASAVAATIASAFDLKDLRAGLKFETAVSKPRGGRGDARLIGLTMRTGPASQLTVSRSFDGALRLRALDEKVTHETVVANDKVQRSLSASARELGATSAVVRRASQLFAHKFDMQRDVKASDEFTLVFDRSVTEAGRTVETGDLLYAELKGHAFYRFQRPGSKTAEYFDATGKNTRSAMMRTPLQSFRRVSSNFGVRTHPISGYRKMHQGMDFAATTGTPIVAPADGVVVEARRWGGYGNWLRIRHSNGLESGYGHLSRYGSGIRAGQRVSQGQIVAYVGSTGASTGPHLHYEIWRGGRRINPAGVKTQEGTVLTGSDLAAFRAEKSRIDRVIAAGGQRRPVVQQASASGLRSVEG